MYCFFAIGNIILSGVPGFSFTSFLIKSLHAVIIYIGGDFKNRTFLWRGVCEMLPLGSIFQSAYSEAPFREIGIQMFIGYNLSKVISKKLLDLKTERFYGEVFLR